MPWIIAAAVVIPGAWLIATRFRRREPESGMASYRRHIDALSPEARRNVREASARNKNGRNDSRR